MTTKWEVPRIFEGQTVAVLAAGPSLTRELADSVRHMPRIAVRRAFELAPDADMLVALDGKSGSLDDSFWNDTRDFAGLKICGTESDEIDAFYPGMMYERVKLGEGNIREIRNSGIAAIRIAAMAGAAKILLLGFDPQQYESKHNLDWFAAGLEQIIDELRSGGIEVERVETTAPTDEVSSFSRRRRK